MMGQLRLGLIEGDVKCCEFRQTVSKHIDIVAIKGIDRIAYCLTYKGGNKWDFIASCI